MDLVNYLLSYFAARNVFYLCAFVCWSPDQIVKLQRDAPLYNIRVSILSFSDFRALHPVANGFQRDGILLDVNCPGSEDVVQHASQTRAFNLRFTWILLDNSPYNESKMNDYLDGVTVLADADVLWFSTNKVIEMYRLKPKEPLILLEHNWTSSATQQEMALHWGRRPTSVTLRRNFGRIRIVGVVVLVFPQVFKGWNDFTNMQIDNFPKFSYPLVLTLADDLNFRLAVRQLDIYGEHTNGSFNGLAGMLQRGEAEIGATSMFMREDRSHVMHFCAETVILRGVFLFRQPSQSAVSNIFLLPFSRGVWACSMAVFALSGLFVAALGRPLAPVDSTLEAITPGEAVTFTVGAICQQGFYLSPNLASMRIAMLFTLVTSVFAFTSYSAKIVAILQTPSDAIQTTADLAKSSIACGSQDTTYRKTYFEESVDPAVQHLYKHKMLPYGDRAYLSVVDGVERLRTEFFAYQVEQAAGYDVITKTFTEQEKCMLTEIEAFRLPTVAVPIKKNSGFRDIFGTRFRWQREVGLMDRSARRWFAKKPRCEQGSSSFVTVGLTDCLPAVQVLAYGMLASILVLIGEIFTRKFQVKRGQRKMLHHNTSTCLIS